MIKMSSSATPTAASDPVRPAYYYDLSYMARVLRRRHDQPTVPTEARAPAAVPADAGFPV
jgi:hypothetical protein